MPLDREDTLKTAEKLLRQGRLEAAIAEYVRLVEDQPLDWATANTLGELYVRAGQPAMAVEQYARIAQHLVGQGFYSKAAALYKKLLKLNPADEGVVLQLGEISQKQGLLADAKAHFSAVAAARRARGDRAGAAELVVRLGDLDPVDFDARTAAARMRAEMGDHEGAAERFRQIYTDLLEKGREADALSALREAVGLNPYEREGRAALARAALAAGDSAAARELLDRETAGRDPGLLAALLEIELQSGSAETARALAASLAGLGAEAQQQVVRLAWTVAPTAPASAYALVDAAVDAVVAAGEHAEAVALVQQFLTHVPHYVPALERLIEISVDGGLEGTMNEAQGQLAEAYLEKDQPLEARRVAEDLIAREPWVPAHLDRFRRALVLLKVAEPDTVIAERLDGRMPFTAVDRFAETPPSSSAPEQEHTAVPAPADQVEPERPAPSASSLDEAFREFRQGVASVSGAADSTQHMTLARTYLQMGMTDEAMSSLQAAADSPRLRFEAAGMLARLFRERGDTGRALRWFERAAEAPAPGAEEGRSLLYDLAALVEESGDRTRALAIFMDLQSDAENYRDVPQRIERLSRTETGG